MSWYRDKTRERVSDASRIPRATSRHNFTFRHHLKVVEVYAYMRSGVTLNGSAPISLLVLTLLGHPVQPRALVVVDAIP